MQKKVTKKKVNKKAPQRRGASQEMRRDSIFNYDLEIDDDKTINKRKKKVDKLQNKKASKDNGDFLLDEKFIGAKEMPAINKRKLQSQQKRNKRRGQDDLLYNDKFIGAKETKPIDKKKLDRIKKKKKKEINKRKRAIKKQEENEERQRQLNKKRLNSKQLEHIRKVKNVIRAICLIIILLILLVLFLLSPVFNVNEITVTGNNKISVNEIISLTRIQNGTNLFKMSKKDIQSNVKQQPYIRSIEIKRVLPNKMELTVIERELEFLFEFGNSYAYIGSEGYILEINSENVADKLHIVGYATSEEMIKPGNRLCSADLKSLNAVIQIMLSAKNNALDGYIKRIDISDNLNFILYLDDERKKVELGDTSNLDTKMLYIQVMIEREKNRDGTIFTNVDLRNKYPYFSENVYR